MNYLKLRDALKIDEGLRLQAYPDPLTKGDPWTIGHGHTGRDVYEGLVWTAEDAEGALDADIATAANRLNVALPWLATLNDVRQNVLINMAFNMGTDGLLKFKHMLAAIKDNDFDKAAAEMLDSTWHEQVGNRAYRLAYEMKTGEFP